MAESILTLEMVSRTEPTNYTTHTQHTRKMKNSFNIRLNPIHKIGITITNNRKGNQTFYTLSLVGTKKSLNLPYNSIMGENYLSHAIAFLGSCGIRVANQLNSDENNTMFIIGFGYYDKVMKLFSFAR